MIDKGISYDIPQLAKPKGNGRKRQGYRGDDAYGGGGNKGGNNNGNNGGNGGGRQDTESQYGGDYSYDSSQNKSDRDQKYGGVTYKGPAELGVTTRKVNTIDMPEPERDTGLEKQRELNDKILDKFKKTRPDINIPEFSKLPTLFNLGLNLFEKPLQKFSDFTTAKNREFFEDVIRAGNIPGLDFANLTDVDIEQAYQDYMDDRMSGKTDAYGREINRDQGASGILQNLLMPLAPILESQEGITSIPSQSLNYAYTPDRRIVIAPGTALGRGKITI
jgi:hypothetical protein